MTGTATGQIAFNIDERAVAIMEVEGQRANVVTYNPAPHVRCHP